MNGQDLVYLDNAATSQTPNQVIDVIADFYKAYNANIHRGVHTMSQEATDKFEQARQNIQTHFNIRKSHEVIFTSGTTHSINLVAFGFGTLLSHWRRGYCFGLRTSCQYCTWQMMCERSGAILRVIPMTDNGTLDMHAYKELLNKKTKLVFVNHVSNALGTINPIEEIINKAHKVGAAVLVDGAQACGHIKPNLKKLNVDFYTVSAHKLCGPTGMAYCMVKKNG